MRTRMWTVVAAMIMAGTVAACGNGADQPGPTGGSTNSGQQPPAANTPTCALAPASLVNSVLGTNVGDPKAQELCKFEVCRYDPAGGRRDNVVVRIQTHMSRDTFDKGRKISDDTGLKTTDLPGFQDAAYTRVLSAGSVTTNTVVALK